MNHALAVLEFDAIRERLARHCETELAVALAAELEPQFEADAVWNLLDATTEAYRVLADGSPPALSAVRDYRNGLNRASKGATLGAAELFGIAESLSAMRAWRGFLSNRRSDFPKLWMHVEAFPELKLLEEQILGAIEPSGDLRDSASPELARIRQRKTTIGARILDRIQSYTSGRARELLSDPIYTIRDGRYVVPVKSENRGKIRGIVHDTSSSGQTVYVEPEEVLQLGNQLREIEAAERDEIGRILGMLSAKVGKSGTEITRGVESAGDLDFLLSKARLAFAMKAAAPQKSAGHGVSIEGGKHPLLDPSAVVPLTLSVGFDFQGLLITGPNTGGKTVAIKTVGLLVLMAQSGLYVPAIDFRLGPVTQVWADIGDEQSIQQSLSTFSGHIKNIADAVKNVRSGALVLFDEVGAGTDPAEGAALAKAILTSLRDSGAIMVASTHYGELKAFAFSAEGFRNAAMEFDVKSLKPTYRLLMGAPGASHALRIAERYGLPRSVIDAAKEGLSEEHQELGKLLEQLENAQKRARIAQSEADRRIHDLKQAEKRAAEKLAEADEIRKNVHAKASQAVEDALREIRGEAAKVFEELKSAPRSQQAMDAARGKLRDVQEYGEAAKGDFAPARNRPALVSDKVLRKGMNVRVTSYNQDGVLLGDPANGSVQVQVGALKLSLPVSDLVPITAKEASKGKPRTNVGLHKAQTASTEIHLRALRAEDAMDELERFIDDAVLAGLPSLRIVHGKGEGILRKLTQDYLRRHPHIASFRDGESGEGGHGVTIAVIK